MSGPLCVYIAGSSLEIPRVRRAQELARNAGCTVVGEWTAAVERFGSAPADESHRARAAEDCIHAIAAADVVWLLVPAEDAPSRGAWVEWGYAYGRAWPGVASGLEMALLASGARADVDAAIFATLADEVFYAPSAHEADDLAADRLAALAEEAAR